METEPDFLRLATDLQDVYACAAEMAESTDRQVASLRGAVGETRLAGADGLAGRVLAGLRSAIADTENELDSLHRICGELLRLVQLGDRIGLTAIFLNAARYSFRVESARTEATRQSFGAFAEELEPLSNQIGAVGEAISARARSAHCELTGLVRSIRGDSAQLHGVTAETGETVERTCARGQELLDSSSSLLAEAPNRARQRQQHADHAIYHVQFGDIVRQKIEHIAAALSESAASIADSGATKGTASLAHVDRTLAIQLGQIELVASEVRSAGQGLPEAFAGLGQETTALAASLRSLGRGASDHDALEELRTELHHMEDLESQGRTMQSQARDSWQRALDTSREASRRTDELREINFRMHLQSLNAIIKTEWLGREGRTLGVLSSHMHTVFRESSGLVADTVGVLETIASRTAGSETLPGAESARPEGDLGSSLKAGLRAVSRLRQEFNLTIEAADRMATRQASQLEQARKSIDFLDDLARRLEGLGGEIRELRKRIAPLLGGADAARDCTTESYTMESEREVHRRHTIALTPEHTEPAPECVTAGTAEDPGDNVDFF